MLTPTFHRSRDQLQPTRDAADARLQTQFDFAAMALKGKRYDEAERRYTQLIEDTQYSLPWRGLGIAKLARVYLAQTTPEEVQYCFEKARSANPAQRAKIDALFAQSAVGTIVNLNMMLAVLRARAISEQQRAAAGALVGAESFLLGSGQKANMFTQLVGFSGVNHAAEEISQATAALSRLPDAANHLQVLIEDLTVRVRSFGSASDETYRRYIDALDQLQAQTNVKTALIDPETGNAKPSSHVVGVARGDLQPTAHSYVESGWSISSTSPQLEGVTFAALHMQLRLRIPTPGLGS